MVVVIVALNEYMPTKSEFISMMNVLLSTEKNAEEKKALLEQQFHIPMQAGIGKELDLMCNLSGYVEQKGIEKGIEKSRLETARNLLKLGMDPELIAQVTSLPVQRIRELQGASV